jgi:hypothetical protein
LTAVDLPRTRSDRFTAATAQPIAVPVSAGGTSTARTRVPPCLPTCLPAPAGCGAAAGGAWALQPCSERAHLTHCGGSRAHAPVCSVDLSSAGASCESQCRSMRQPCKTQNPTDTVQRTESNGQCVTDSMQCSGQHAADNMQRTTCSGRCRRSACSTSNMSLAMCAGKAYSKSSSAKGRYVATYTRTCPCAQRKP